MTSQFLPLVLLVSRASDSFSSAPEYVDLVEVSLKASKFLVELRESASEKLRGVWTCHCPKNVGDKICPERES